MENSDWKDFEEKLLPLIEKGIKRRVQMEKIKIGVFYGTWTIAIAATMILKHEGPVQIARGLLNHSIIVLTTDKYLHRAMTMTQSELCRNIMMLFFVTMCCMHPEIVRVYFPFYFLTLCRLLLLSYDWFKREREVKKEKKEKGEEGVLL